MNQEVRDFAAWLLTNEITIALDSRILVTIKVNGEVSKVWAFNESNHPRFEVNQ